MRNRIWKQGMCTQLPVPSGQPMVPDCERFWRFLHQLVAVVCGLVSRPVEGFAMHAESYQCV